MSKTTHKKHFSEVIGLDIQANQVVMNVYTPETPQTPENETHREAAVVPLPAGTIVHGQLVKPQALTEAIKTGLAALKTKTRHVAVSIPTAAGVFQIISGETLPPGADTLQYLKTNHPNHAPHLNKKTHVIHLDTTEVGSATQYSFTSAPKQTLSEYAIAITKANLKIIDIELCITATPKAAQLTEMHQNASVWIHYEPHISVLMLTFNGVPFITQYLSHEPALTNMAQRLDFPSEEHLFAGAHQAETHMLATYKDLSETVKNRMHMLWTTSSVNGWQFTFSNLSYYTGNIFDLNPLPVYIVNVLQEDFPLEPHDTIHPIQHHELAAYGIALKHLTDVPFPNFSLLKKGVRTIDSTPMLWATSGAILASSVAVAGVIWFTQNNTKTKLRESITAQQSTLASLQPYTNEFVRLENRNQEISQVLKLQNDVERTRTPWDEYLQNFITFIPDAARTVKLTNLAVSKPEGIQNIIKGKATSVVYAVKGESKQYNDIVRFLKSYETSNRFVVQLNNIAKADTIYSFTAIIGGVDQGGTQ